MVDHEGLSPEACAIIAEEEALLARVLDALDAAGPRATVHDREAYDTLTRLRDDAMSTSHDDLPGVLHELAVRHTLVTRTRETTLPSRDAPYIGHLRLVEDGKSPRDYCLGSGTLSSGPSGVRVIDWRVAPIAEVFYRYREGDEYEEALPGRIVTGVVAVRRLIVIEASTLRRVIGDGYAYERDASGTWRTSDRAFALAKGGARTSVRQATLGLGIGTAERAEDVAVTASLDQDQYAAIMSPSETPLLVLGSAGSGKTTVALHRLARLLATSGDEVVRASRVIVPEEGLARLTRRLLASIGRATPRVSTLDDWSRELAEETFARRLRICPDTPSAAVSLKRHPVFFRAFMARTRDVSLPRASFDALRALLVDALTDRVFLAEVVRETAGGLHGGVIDTVVRHTMAQLAESPRALLASLTVPELRRGIDDRDIIEDTPEAVAGTVDLEDLPILLHLRARLGVLDTERITHLVLDEAEDFSLFDLSVLAHVRDRAFSITLAGDEAQQTSMCFDSWEATLHALETRDASTCRLDVSYRCPRPVTDLAAAVLGDAHARPIAAIREGAPVGRFTFPSEDAAWLFGRDALIDLVAAEPRASVAVIAQDAATAERYHALFTEHDDARLVLDGAFTFEPGIDVTHVDAVKGLEFDYVLVPDATSRAYPDTTDARRRLHVAVTRTSHQLWLLSGDAPSPLVPEPS